MKKYNKGFTKLEILLALLLVLMLGNQAYSYFTSQQDGTEKQNDAVRISNIDQIRTALIDYYNVKSVYPACLYKSVCGNSLEGSTIMPAVPKDPLTGIGYSYAAFGSGTKCTGFHLGSSLERKASQALITGADAPPQPKAALCPGSTPDFSGLSYAPGGQPCNLAVGIPQPTDDPRGETCYDRARGPQYTMTQPAQQ